MLSKKKLATTAQDIIIQQLENINRHTEKPRAILLKPSGQNGLNIPISTCLNKDIEKQQAPIVEAVSGGNLFNLAKLENVSQGDLKFVQKMIGIFTTETKTALKDINKAFENSDIKTINYVAHKIKPSIIFMGIESLKETVLKLEKFPAPENSTEELGALIIKLENVLHTVFGELAQLEA